MAQGVLELRQQQLNEDRQACEQAMQARVDELIVDCLAETMN
jgi:hypothetical protein